MSHDPSHPDELTVLHEQAGGISRDLNELETVALGHIATYESEGVTEADQQRLLAVAGEVGQLSVQAEQAAATLTDATNKLHVIQPEAMTQLPDAAFEALTRFVERKMAASETFTYADMEIYLYGKGVHLPESASSKRKLLDAELNEIEGIIDDASTTSKVIAHAMYKGRKVFAVQDQGPKAHRPIEEAPEEPESFFQPPVRLSSPTEPGDAPRYGAVVPFEERLQRSRVLDILQQNPDLTVAATRRLVANEMEMEVDDVKRLMAAMVADEQLHLGYQDKRRIYRTEPFQPAAASKPAKQERAQPQGLSQTERQVAKVVLAAFSRVPHITQLLSPSQVRNKIEELGLPLDDVTPEIIKSIARQLERQGIMQQTQAKQGKKSPRSKRATVFKVGLASQAVKNKLKTEEGRQELFVLVESGEPFEGGQPEA